MEEVSATNPPLQMHVHTSFTWYLNVSRGYLIAPYKYL